LTSSWRVLTSQERKTAPLSSSLASNHSFHSSVGRSRGLSAK
jgi:hypothetical protein